VEENDDKKGRCFGGTTISGDLFGNQTLFSALTVMSLVETPLTGVVLGDDLRSKKLKRLWLTVSLERHEAPNKSEKLETVAWTFQGRRGFS